MTVLLLGKNGQLGRGLQRALLPFGNLVAFARDELDLDKPEVIAERLNAVRPDIIVNAAAYTQVDLAETKPCSIAFWTICWASPCQLVRPDAVR